jgi:uncharacterized protein (TIGR03083 family)
MTASPDEPSDDETSELIAHLIDCVDLVYRETIALSRTLTTEQAALATGCPGWTVHDQLAHMVGLEQSLSGSPEPTVDVPAFDHVQNDIGRYMERHVHARRGLPFAAVVDEMAGLRPRRIAQLQALANDGDVELTTPWGAKRSLSESLHVRVMDLWSHEQDIRLAVGAPQRTDGPDGDLAEARTLRAWQALLPKTVEGPGRIHIAFTDGNRTTATVELASENGAGSEGTEGHADRPELSISGSRSALTGIGFGRRPKDAYLARAEIDGDDGLRERVLPHLGFTP